MAGRIRIRRKIRRRSPSLRHPGGAAARMQQKQPEQESGVMIGGALDPAEKAADARAAAAMGTTPAGTVQRKCAECAEEENEVQRAASAPSLAPGHAAAPAPASAAKAITGLGAGRPMSTSERGFFEPRFGQDFSSVRIHEGPAADYASRSIGAEAFTMGRDLAFAKGAKTPDIMAHELAHISENEGISRRKPVRRYTLATADHPTTSEFLKVPDKHKPRVDKALGKIEEMIKKPNCRNYFKDNCTADGANKLNRAQNAFDNATVYFMDDKTSRFGASITRRKNADSRTIAYNRERYNTGFWAIANTLTHEMFHTCILGAIAKEEEAAEKAAEACRFYTPVLSTMTPASAAIGDTVTLTGIGLGPQQDASHKLFLNGTKIIADSWVINAGSSGNTIKFTIPAGAKSGEVHIENHNVKSAAKKLTITP